MMSLTGATRGSNKRSQPFVLTDLDKAILTELTGDPFASNAVVAEKVGVAASMVSSRLRILDRHRVSHVLAVIDLEHMRQSFCFIRVNVRGRSVSEVAEALSAFRLVLMVSELADGASDLLVLLRFSDVRCLNKTLYRDFAAIGGVASWTINIVIDVPLFRSEYITYAPDYLPLNIDKNLEYLKSDIPAGICDDIDLQIIAHLQQNARQSINDVARKLDLKPSTARYRINNLKTAEIVRFIRVLDNRSVGITSFALVEIDADVGQIEQVVEKLVAYAWFPQLFRCAGDTNLIGIILAGGPDEILRIRHELLSAFTGINAVRLTYLHNTRKIDYRWARKVT